jgi:hypothetical protein
MALRLKDIDFVIANSFGDGAEYRDSVLYGSSMYPDPYAAVHHVTVITTRNSLMAVRLTKQNHKVVGDLRPELEEMRVSRIRTYNTYAWYDGPQCGGTYTSTASDSVTLNAEFDTAERYMEVSAELDDMLREEAASGRRPTAAIPSTQYEGHDAVSAQRVDTALSALVVRSREIYNARVATNNLTTQQLPNQDGSGRSTTAAGISTGYGRQSSRYFQFTAEL